MRKLKDLLTIFDRQPKQMAKANFVSTGRRGFGGASARKTGDDATSAYFNPIIQRAGINSAYSNLSNELIRQLPATSIRDLIKDADPIVAKALSDFATTVAGGYTWTADKTQPDSIDTPGHRLLSTFLQRMERQGNSLEQKNEEAARGMFTHGGIFFEMIFDVDQITPIDLKVLSPTSAVFRRTIAPIRGEIYELGQRRSPFGPNDIVIRRPGDNRTYGENFVSLEDDPTVQYRPIQSDANNPYGTPILNPAVASVLIVAGFMNALQAGLAQFVSPNLLVTIDREKFNQFSNNRGDSKKIEEEFNALVGTLQEQISKLKAGGFIIHGDEVGVDNSFSNTGRSPLGTINDLRNTINNDLMRAVQSYPILMGSNEAVGETHAIEQRKAYGNLITRSQKPLSSLITYYFNLVLQVNNLPPLAEYRLNYQNVAEFQAQALAFQNLHQGLKTQAEGRKAFTEALEQDVEAGYLEADMAQAIYDERIQMERQFNAIPQSGGYDQ